MKIRNVLSALAVAGMLGVASIGGAQAVTLNTMNGSEPGTLDPHKASGDWNNRIIGDYIEGLVAEVYAEILQVEKVGALDDFFALGGNSLRGMRAMARIRAEVDVDLPMRALFSSPVVADLAAQIEQRIAAELDGLSDTEVAALLAAEEGTN